MEAGRAFNSKVRTLRAGDGIETIRKSWNAGRKGRMQGRCYRRENWMVGRGFGKGRESLITR